MQKEALMDNQDLDYRWFIENLADLYRQYGSSYIAIKDKTVLGAYGSYAEGVKEILRTEAKGSFIVQKCAPDESYLTIKMATLFI